MDSRRPFLILNPVSGPVWRRRRQPRLIDHLARLYPGLEVARTTGPGHATALARAAVGAGCDLVLAAGGDGTCNEVINGLLPSDVALAVLPTGTGNSLARELELGIDPLRAAARLRRGAPRPVYLARCNGRLFALMAGAGFDAHVIAAVTPRRKRLGVTAYLIAGFAALARYPYPPMRFRIDGRDCAGFSGVVCKARCYGGPFSIAPQAGLERPRLVLCLLRGRGAARFLVYGAAALVGMHTRLPDVEFHEGERIELLDGVPLQIDGEPFGVGPAVLTVAADRLNLVYPGSS